jgi:D-serine deaminase-like pyridoxal phosphate-dependent protein
MANLDDLLTPAVLIDRGRLQNNIRSMQRVCDEHRVELRPHIKTHKMVAVARLQLAAGARGLTCAKLGEAEALLPSGTRRVFIAHSLTDPRQAPRIAALAEQLDELRVAGTSEAQVEALAQLARFAGRRLLMMMALDTGLGREGVRDLATAKSLAAAVAGSSHLELAGIYTHEGHLYSAPIAEQARRVNEVIEKLVEFRDAISRSLPLWPGCSVSARLAAGSGRVQAVRPGAYIFGDLHLSHSCRVMTPEEISLNVLATVVDKPEPGLALIDAGSKTFSSDRTADGIFALAADDRDLSVQRVNEEHGFVRGTAVDSLRIGERVRFIPAHVCPVVNLTDEVVVTENGDVAEKWRVEARGRAQ